MREAALRGTTFGASTEAEVELAAEIVDAVPSIEKVAARLVGHRSRDERDPARARLHEARPHLKFAGCYHGHVDALLASAGSGLATLAIPSTPGVPTRGHRRHDRLPVQRRRGGRRGGRCATAKGLAAIIVEPVAGNMGVVPPVDGFLEALRQLCDASGALLVFDEVITGFRVARGGAQERFGVAPDLTILGKIVGGGLPLAAFGGRADVMDAARAERACLPGRARSPAIRSRPPRASRCCAASATRPSTRSSSARARGSRRASREHAHVQPRRRDADARS